MADETPLFVLKKIFTDPTPGGRINQRIVQRFFVLTRELTDLNEDEVDSSSGFSCT